MDIRGCFRYDNHGGVHPHPREKKNKTISEGWSQRALTPIIKYVEYWTAPAAWTKQKAQNPYNMR